MNPKRWRPRAKLGLPPGSLVHVGERRAEAVRISIVDYDADRVEEIQDVRPQDCIPYRKTPSVTWINVDGLHEVDKLAELGKGFGLHPLVLEDILHTEQRPKLEDYGDYLYIVFNMLSWDQEAEAVTAEQISLVLGPTFVLTFQERRGDLFDPLRERIRAGKGHIRTTGADYLAYALLDNVVDHYFVLLEVLGEQVAALEDRLLTQPGAELLQLLHNLKREALYLRRSVWPLREVVGRFERGGSPLISQSTAVYGRDLYDHTVQTMDAVETLREVLAGMMEVYLSSASNRINEVMKVLTVIATVFIPLTFLAGIWGMNFTNMPELDEPWGYPFALGLMGLVAALMAVFFRHKRWF
ncbi:MAG: magnesium/cobalt transporter CorA [Candidatus Bipolaricaulaceae bacterium]